MMQPITETTLAPAVLRRLDGSTIPGVDALDFDLPAELEAGEPAEARGLARDEVRLMVSYRGDDHVEHAQFREITRFLEAGDVLVVNTSGTLPAALAATRADGTPLELHLSTRLPADLWIVEVRRPAPEGTQPFATARAGETLALPGGGAVTLLTPYQSDRTQPAPAAVRLWVATLRLPAPLLPYLEEHGFPIRYSYVREAWPPSYYQTAYVTEMGSAEMPSAGRAFTPDLLTRLVAMGVQIAPLLLHTGVASLEDHEPPYEEFYRVPAATARLVNTARAAGKRIVAVGTTVVRALETVTDEEGMTHPGEGWTRLLVTPERGVRAVNALLTGFHEPRATHLAMLEAIAGVAHLQVAYAAALEGRYLWHEFGDLHLLLPECSQCEWARRARRARQTG
jgi:S-adenosylmethionine:tRNA ribosyltransferase-isomerase